MHQLNAVGTAQHPIQLNKLRPPFPRAGLDGNETPLSDPEASWARRSKAGAKDGYELVFGHSLQVVADANHDLPLALRETTGSRSAFRARTVKRW